MSCRAKKPKKYHLKRSKYRVKNWSEYNLSLKKRGSIIVWVDPQSNLEWYYTGTRQAGGKMIYSDEAIRVNLTVRSVYHQPMRQTQGMVEDIVKLIGMDVSVPDYTVVSKRAKKLDLTVERFSTKDAANERSNETVYMIIDSTGLKIYGEGEWASVKHKTKIRRSWRKLHISVDRNGEIQATTLTDHRTNDASQVRDLQAQVSDPIDRVIADGAYDTQSVYQLFLSNDPTSRLIIPPRENAVLSDDTVLKQRNNHLTYIQKNGRRQWEESSGYTQQARVENTMFRYKTIIGGKLRSRTFDRQQNEAVLCCSILNKMTSLGMPVSFKVAA